MTSDDHHRSYMLASELHTHLDVLSTSLSQLIEAVNALSLPITADGSPPTPGDDPMDQIAQILSSHLDSLQWIDGAVREVEGKVTEVERRIKDSGAANAGVGNAGLKLRAFGNR
jgi:nuclear pore complex protein Nup62